ncbi:MAG: hypothetical protein PHX61_04850 [Alphaproteobacteria bacterium]|nr:hypothetical protein [Alphaproteobacteria bacterium]
MSAVALDHFEYRHVVPSNDVSPRFDVFDAFSRLETSRKMRLLDLIMLHRTMEYKRTMGAFWPQSTESDAHKLEIMLKHRLEKIMADEKN